MIDVTTLSPFKDIWPDVQNTLSRGEQTTPIPLTRDRSVWNILWDHLFCKLRQVQKITAYKNILSYLS